MPWIAASRRLNGFPNASCFVDESLEPLAPALQKLGHARNVCALRLSGGYAEADRQIVLTQNRDYLDDRRFSPHRHAGVVVLADEYDESLIKSLMSTLSLVEQGRELWEGAKIVVSGNGRITVTNHDHKSGTRYTSHYKLRLTGPPLVWMSEDLVPRPAPVAML
jgi:hypothetical protein